jgi:hypothetical protein
MFFSCYSKGAWRNKVIIKERIEGGRSALYFWSVALDFTILEFGKHKTSHYPRDIGN